MKKIVFIPNNIKYVGVLGEQRNTFAGLPAETGVQPKQMFGLNVFGENRAFSRGNADI